MAHAKHEPVRCRYEFRCGYCGVTETDTGGQLTVDHFHPTSSGGDDSDDNLMYACFRCNLHKSDFYPTQPERDAGYYLLHPLRDVIATHYREDSTSHLLIAETIPGATQIAILQLNRPELVAFRQSRWRELQRAQRIELLETRLNDLYAILQGQIGELTNLLLSDTPDNRISDENSES